MPQRTIVQLAFLVSSGHLLFDSDFIEMQARAVINTYTIQHFNSFITQRVFQYFISEYKLLLVSLPQTRPCIIDWYLLREIHPFRYHSSQYRLRVKWLEKPETVLPVTVTHQYGCPVFQFCFYFWFVKRGQYCKLVGLVSGPL